MQHDSGMQAKPFSLLASVYDVIMEDIEYEAWAVFILALAKEVGWSGRRVLDLGCGTGNSTFPFYAQGFTVVGVDASAEMLALARAKLPPVRFVQADFTGFALGERFDLVVSVFDSMNNLLTPQAFMATLERVRVHLEPTGLFIFDVNTTVGLRHLWQDGRAEGWADDVYYCWEHSFDETTRLAKVVATCERGARSFTEVHVERPYDPPELRHLLEQAGFTDVRVVLYPDGRTAPADAERVWVLGRNPPPRNLPLG